MLRCKASAIRQAHRDTACQDNFSFVTLSLSKGNSLLVRIGGAMPNPHHEKRDGQHQNDGDRQDIENVVEGHHHGLPQKFFS